MGIVELRCEKCGREVHFMRDVVEFLKKALCLPCARPDLFKWVDDDGLERIEPVKNGGPDGGR